MSGASNGSRGDDGPIAAALSRREILTVMSGLMLGMFLAALDQTVVATAIRVIGDDLNDLSNQAWVTTAFLITSTITTPLYGKLSDMYGRKPFFLFAITVFIVGSALCSLASTMYMLAGFRAFQGVGAGGLFTLAFAIIGDIVSPRERAKYQGYFIAVFGTSSVLGPLIGGALAGQDTILGFAGWRWIFLVNVPIGILALIVVSLVLHLPRRNTRQPIDYAGAALLVVGLVPLLLVAEQGRTWGWTSMGSIACYLVGAAGVVGFVRTESKQGDAALLPLRLFRSRPFALSAGQTALIGVGMFGAITVLPLYLQIVKGASPTEAGLLTLPLVGGIMVASLTSGQITSRTGHYGIFPKIGSALMVVAMLLLWRLTADSSLLYVDGALALLGLGLGCNMQSLTLAMQNAVSLRDMGVATASSTFARQIGGTLGVAAFLSILYSSLSTSLASSFAAAQSDPAFQAAAAADPQGAQLLRSPALIDDTSALERLPAALTAPWKEGFADAMSSIFLVGVFVLLVALLLALVTKELPLRGGPPDADREALSRKGEVDESPHPAAVASTRACREGAVGRSAARELVGSASGGNRMGGPR